MAKVLMCWEAGDGLGYAEGLASIARPVRQAGFEVAVAWRSLAHAERLLGKDFVLFQAPTTVALVRDVIDQPRTFAEQLHNMGFGDARQLLGRVRAWRRLIQDYRPDVVRCLHSPGALLALRGLGIKTVVPGTGFLIPPPVSPLPNLRHWEKDVDAAALLKREQHILGEFNQVLTALGAPTLARLCDLYDVDVQEIYSFPELDEYGVRPNGNYVGSWQVQGGAAPTWPAGDGRKIFVYLENFKALPELLKALKQTGAAVLVFIAHLPEEQKRQHAGANLAFTDVPLDLAATAQQCDYGVNHGGLNITSTLLRAGKPQLQLPMFLPERLCAENVMRLGAGVASPLVSPNMGEALSLLLQTPLLAVKANEFAARHAGESVSRALDVALADVQRLAKQARGTGLSRLWRR
jgi:hypothetical protein